MGLFKSYPTDMGGVPIEAGSELHVSEFDIATDAWAKITVPEDIDCKRVFMRTRDGEDFKLSHLDDGGSYITMPGAGQELAVAKLEKNTLCYVQATAAGTLEVLFIY